MPRTSFRRPATWLLASWAFLGGGCFGKGGPPTARLEGTVTIGGEPVAKGAIQFLPASGEQGPPAGAEIVAGKYLAEGVPLGQVNVLINATKETGRMITEYSNPYPEVVNIVPERYRSGMPLEVSGDGVLDFPLEGG